MTITEATRMARLARRMIAHCIRSGDHAQQAHWQALLDDCLARLDLA